MNRKQRRAIAKAQKKKGNKDLAEKMMMFDKLPDECYMCESEFDKTDREMVSSWNVVVRESQNRVNLYCPSCWESAHEMMADIMETLQKVKNKEEQCEKG
tara:strand:- start:715 stop:1014 length:300 start_codon:yes stop_codon:yes gene_type:complete